MRTGEWLGLQKLMVRTHGMFELAQVLPREIQSSGALVVGNPTEDLGHAEAAATDIHKLFQGRGWQVGEPVMRSAATPTQVLPALQNENLGVFLYSGHGDDGLLKLVGHPLYDADLRRTRWPGGPFIHYDCCNTGRAWTRGGGRMAGMPVETLAAGASAVLSSSVPLYDEPAADFSRTFYRALLDPRQPRTLGEALMHTRREIHDKFKDQPGHWASSVLWGNPAVRLTQRR
jgi:hypothetical protein